MDDIVVWGKDQAEHDTRLKQVMDKAEACGLKFNKGKCKFRQNQISYVIMIIIIIIHSFYLSLFYALEQTQCADVACDSE